VDGGEGTGGSVRAVQAECVLLKHRSEMGWVGVVSVRTLPVHSKQKHPATPNASPMCPQCAPDAHLGQHAGVRGLDHRVDDGLRVDDDLDVVVVNAVEVVRLNHLKTLWGGVERSGGWGCSGA